MCPPLPSPRSSHADRTTRSRHRPGGRTHQRPPGPRRDPARVQSLPGGDRLRLAPRLVRPRSLGLGDLRRHRHARRRRRHRAPGARVAAHRDQPLHLLRRLLRRTGPARRLGGRPAALARLHRADPLDRRRRDGGDARQADRPADRRRLARRRLRGARRLHGGRRGVRLPAAPQAEQGPRRRHDPAPGPRTRRLRRGLHDGGGAGHPVPPRLLLADLAVLGRGRRPQRTGRLHHPARRLHPVRLPRAAQLPDRPAGHLSRPGRGTARPPALRYVHGARRRGDSTTRGRSSPPRPPGTWSRC